LSGSERLILIDEVHKLINPTRSNDSALHMLRDLHDNTGCPMLWVGTSDILTHIQDRRFPRSRTARSDLQPHRPLGGPGGGDDAARWHQAEPIPLDDIKKVLSSRTACASAPTPYEYLHKHANLKGSGALRACGQAGADRRTGCQGRSDHRRAARPGLAAAQRHGQVAKMRRQQMRAQDEQSGQRMVAAG
jgi:hypothetical protein